METLAGILFGFTDILHLPNLSAIVLGVVIGIVFGALPGLTATMGVAVFTPLTFSLPPEIGISFLLGIYVGGMYGGSITAILIRTPGTPASVVTTFDGYPLAQNGRAGEALYMALFASFFGGIVSGIILITIAPQLAKFALKFGPAEYFALTVFGMSIIASVSGKRITKGLLAGLLGILLTLVGMDGVTGVDRFTFGTTALLSGFNLIPVLIGIFAVSEVLYQVRHTELDGSNAGTSKSIRLDRTYIPIRELFKYFGAMIRSSLIGTFIGVVPGTGGGIASFIAYDVTKRVSRNAAELGNGSMEGVATAEAANNAVTGGALVPLLTLGIPGDSVTAVLISAFMIQGLQPGPLLFQSNPRTVYALFAGLIMANIVMYLVGVFGVKIYAKVLRIRILVLCPIVLILCFVGAYSVAGNSLDLVIMMVMGVIGYYFRKHGFPSGPLVIGMILGPMVEKSLRQSLTTSQGDWTIFLKSPISVVFLVLTVASIFLPVLMKKKLSKIA